MVRAEIVRRVGFVEVGGLGIGPTADGVADRDRVDQDLDLGVVAVLLTNGGDGEFTIFVSDGEAPLGQFELECVGDQPRLDDGGDTRRHGVAAVGQEVVEHAGCQFAISE